MDVYHAFHDVCLRQNIINLISTHMLMLENIMNTVYNALLLGKRLFESICLNIFVPTTGLRAIEYEKMLSESSSSSSKTNKRLLPLPAPIPRRRIANIDPDIDGGDDDIDIDQGDPDIDQADPDIDQGDPGSAVPVADVAIDQGDPDLDGGDEEGGVGEYASFILGAKVQ